MLEVDFVLACALCGIKLHKIMTARITLQPVVYKTQFNLALCVACILFWGLLLFYCYYLHSLIWTHLYG
jgi:hypothetical protein